MKRLLIAVILLAFGTIFTTNAHAQTPRVGIKVGANLANVNGDDASDDADPRFGFHGGAMVNLRITDAFALQPEILYTLQGSESEFEFFGQNVEVETSLNYLQVPVMGRFYFAEILYGEFGPYIAFLLSAEQESDGEEVDIDDDISSTDFGIGFGAGVELPAGFTAGLRYNLGLSSIDDTELDADVFNSVLQVSVGYFFN